MPVPSQLTHQDLLLSFVIPTYKNGHSLRNCVVSIREACQQLHLPYEVFVVDNYPDDTYLKVIQEEAWQEVKTIKNPVKGAHFSRYAGLQQTAGNIVIFTDDDNYLQPDYIRFIRNTIGDAREDIITGCAVQSYHPIDWKKLGFDSWSYACGSLQHCAFKDGVPVYWGAGMAMSKSLANKIFSQELIVEGRVGKGRYIMSGEDHELSLRAYAVGAKFHYYSQVGLLHDFDLNRLNSTYYDQLQIGFRYAAWQLRWYYLRFQNSVFTRWFWVAYLSNMARAFLYFLRYPTGYASWLIWKNALSFQLKKKQFQIVRQYTLGFTKAK